MKWIHPDIPHRFRRVHHEWTALAASEREAYKASLARTRSHAELALFEAWEAHTLKPWHCGRDTSVPVARGGAR